MIAQANLIPMPRRIGRRRRRRVRLWVTTCTIYAVILLIACGALQTVLGRTGSVVEAEVTGISSEIDTTRRDVTALTPKLLAARLTLSASQAVGSQPDWSVLLALLADTLRDPQAGDAEPLVVLSSCELEPVPDVAATAAAAPAPPNSAAPAPVTAAQPRQRFTLRVGGIGKTQAAISQYVLRMEQTGLFEKVALIETKRTPFAGGEAIAFRLGCILGR